MKCQALYIQAIQIADDAKWNDNYSMINGINACLSDANQVFVAGDGMFRVKKANMISAYVLVWSSFTKSSAGTGMLIKDKRAMTSTTKHCIQCQCREMLESENNWSPLSFAKTLCQ